MEQPNTLQAAPLRDSAGLLRAAPLLDYEFVFSEDDFAVVINNSRPLAQYLGYAIDTNGCFVLREASNESLTAPIPLALRPRVEEEQELLFVKIERGGLVDAKVLGRLPATPLID